ncbi:rhodanese-like domain-containing protein [Bosea sp. (in: a-proteobacteria)]|uniref:rhodanese-like domain-containing protein n=1 Tax=Bosea sp. (in: a-proteobacteria) TaxID=1871050 RepID=UPI001203B145|nr:rhodanese-like domain-containing protein [Bosea sp. (in: a-proteobacteria)]TAJ34018.1 MAG: rhodanese-like domain-containing protein [Bosea sp. (in: a-proteobacteria)]
MLAGALTRRLLLAGGFTLPAAFVLGQAPAPSGLPAREAFELLRAGRIVLVDIRSPGEWADTGLPRGAIPYDLDATAFDVRLAGLRLDNPGKRIALIDRTGAQAAATVQKLGGRGWRDLVAVRGGMLGPGGWLAEKLPVVGYP